MGGYLFQVEMGTSPNVKMSRKKSLNLANIAKPVRKVITASPKALRTRKVTPLSQSRLHTAEEGRKNHSDLIGLQKRSYAQTYNSVASNRVLRSSQRLNQDNISESRQSKLPEET